MKNEGSIIAFHISQKYIIQSRRQTMSTNNRHCRLADDKMDVTVGIGIESA